jgi:hypothetical protein
MATVGFNAGVYLNRTVCSIGKSFQSTAFGIEMPQRSKQCGLLTGQRPFGLCFPNTYSPPANRISSEGMP